MIFLDGARLGTTPFKVNLSNQKDRTERAAEADGYVHTRLRALASGSPDITLPS
jgi:hypothetical protein